MWSHTHLAELVEKRRRNREQLPNAEEATLAYARWQGLTKEDNVDREAARQTLDRICDATEPEEWARLKDLVGNVDDQLLRGLMHYALTRSLGQLREQQREVGQLMQPDNSEPTPPTPTRHRPRSRSR
jgi:hypothetical protein